MPTGTARRRRWAGVERRASGGRSAASSGPGVGRTSRCGGSSRNPLGERARAAGGGIPRDAAWPCGRAWSETSPRPCPRNRARYSLGANTFPGDRQPCFPGACVMRSLRRVADPSSSRRVEVVLMGMSRRDVLKAGTLAAFSAGLPLVGIRAAAGSRLPAPRAAAELPVDLFRGLDGLTMAMFSGCLNTRFRIRPFRRSRVGVTLVAVEDRGSRPGGECFGPIFRGGRPHRPLAQDTYAIEHPVLGSFALFVVPMTSDGSGNYYEAVINRLAA